MNGNSHLQEVINKGLCRYSSSSTSGEKWLWEANHAVFLTFTFNSFPV